MILKQWKRSGGRAAEKEDISLSPPWMKIEVQQQVLDFVGSLAPESRRASREGLRKLAQEKGDIRALEGDLEGFYRLRLGRYRVIFFCLSERRTRQIRCVYAAHRTLIYEVFAQHLHELLEP